jgi:exosortase family protein XrtF
VAVTAQTTWVLGVLGYDVRHVTHAKKAAERILLENRPVIAVHEGCNGINVWIIFTGFMIALRVFTRRTLVFWLCGTVILHLANLVRILLLFGVSLTHPEKVYFFHKYFFTAALYVVVFGLWYYWIKYGKAAGAKTS